MEPAYFGHFYCIHLNGSSQGKIAWIWQKSLMNILCTSTQSPIVRELAKSPYKGKGLSHKASEAKQKQ